MIEEKSHVGMSQCYFCGKVKEVMLDRRLRHSLPRQAVYNNEPCNDCKQLMEKGVMFISVSNNSKEEGEPYRTGKVCVLKDSAVERLLSGDILKGVLKHRCAFIDDETWSAIGLPTKEEIGNEN